MGDILVVCISSLEITQSEEISLLMVFQVNETVFVVLMVCLEILPKFP